jgi:hypothetical protein
VIKFQWTTSAFTQPFLRLLVAGATAPFSKDMYEYENIPNEEIWNVNPEDHIARLEG